MRISSLLLATLVATPLAAQAGRIAPAPFRIAPAPSALFQAAHRHGTRDTVALVETGPRTGNSLLMTFIGAGTGYLLVAGANPDASAGATIGGIAAGALAGHLLGGGSLRSARDSSSPVAPDSITARPRLERVTKGAAIGGAVGVVVGFAIGGYLAQRPCQCDDPGIEVIIMPFLGAIVGAVVGASAADKP